ncbi:ChaN family lipoprotein [Halopseudomonas sp.]|uniref:ChaN family lipoprotein n=1 Tax=Halopseudomonas sp. TaxID=2901191 RepID=UPI00356881A1
MRGFLLLLACVWGFAAYAQELPAWVSTEGLDDPHLGKVLDTASGVWLPPSMLVESLVSAPYVLVGEKHDNPDHHRLQLWLMQRLQERRPQGALVMEMIGPAQQAAIDRLQGELSQDGLPQDGLTQSEAQLEKELEWSPGWDWSLYGPLVRWGLALPQRLLAANLTEDEMHAIYQAPPAPADVFSAEMLELLEEAIATSHCGKLAEQQFPAMLAVQQARDERMAQQLAEAPVPALLLAGSYHVRKDLGVPLHWPAEGLQAPLVVMLVEAGGTLPDRAQADFVWLTAALPETDYCAQWEQGQ